MFYKISIEKNRRSRRSENLEYLSVFDFGLTKHFKIRRNQSNVLVELFSTAFEQHFYILAFSKLKIGAPVKRDRFFESEAGSLMSLSNIPIGGLIHCLGSSKKPNVGVFQRSRGTFAQLLQKNEQECTIRLSSGKLKKMPPVCFAILGTVSNLRFETNFANKAGFLRKKGIRPSVRGVAMNPVDHPHGGGEGKGSTGRPSATPWGKPALSTRKRRF